jgi:hypothetical protein
VIMRREGGWVRTYRAHHEADTMTTAGHIVKAMRDIDDEVDKNDWVTAVIDGGVVDRLIELRLPVTPYNGGEAAIDKERFLNARAEDYWTLRELFENGEIDIDPDDDKLAAQLGSIKWGIDSRGRIKIESKDDMPKRGCHHRIGQTQWRWRSLDVHRADRSTLRVMPAKASLRI